MNPPKKIYRRPVVCRNCGTKRTIDEIDGYFEPMNCPKCKTELFYWHSKKKGVLASGYVLIYLDEKTYQEQKEIIPSLLKTWGQPRRKPRNVREDEDDEEDKEVENW
jgi:hypothetical protein